MTTLATVTREVEALRRQVALVGRFTAAWRPASPLALAVAAGIEADAWQATALTSTTPRALWLVARQLGKSSVAALLALFVALTEPGALVLLVAPAERQSAELLRKIRDYARLLGHPIPALGEAVLHLELANGARILALPGRSDATVRGYSAPRLVIVDEAARVADEIMAGVRPMLATSPQGRLLALSTPYGCRGWFWREWVEGADWERVEVVATECRRISPEFLATERRALGKTLYEQEYECRFHAAVDAAFDFAAIDRAVSADVLPLWADAELLAAPSPARLLWPLN